MSVYVDNFKTIFGVKNNIQRLRNKVLELAIQGKLVEQDPNDEPASELVMKIKCQKDAMIKEGKIKKEKSLPMIKEDEISLDIPDNWDWVRLGEVCFKVVDGSHNPPPGINGEGYPMLSAININKTIDFSKPSRIISKSDFEIENNRTNIQRNDVLLTIVGTIGRAVVVNTDEKFTLQRSVAVLKPAIIPDYLKNLLLSPFCYNLMYENAKGTAQLGIYLGKLSNLVLPIPPINEQYRIVSRIEILMSEIDKLEEALQKKELLMDMLPKAVVNAVGNCQSGDELKEQLQLVIKHFNTLFQTPDSMQELRNVILQLSIEGKLLPQDVNDEPALELVKLIKADKAKLVKEGKIKKEKPLPKIDDDEIPFEIPKSWEWERAGNICNRINYGYTASAIYHDTGTKLLRITDIQNGKVDWDKVPYCEIEENKVEQYLLNENDVVIARTGGTIGKSFLIRNVDKQAVYASYLIRMIPNKQIDPNYYYLLVNTPLYWVQLLDGARGGAQPNVNSQTLAKLILPLPPIQEQHRIVEKVEYLMKIIDQIEDKLKRKTELLEKMAN